jgi:hypothetical protein
MLVACRLAGLSALILDHAVKVTRAQCGPTQSPIASSPSSSRPKPCASRTEMHFRAGTRVWRLSQLRIGIAAAVCAPRQQRLGLSDSGKSASALM